MKTIIYNLAFYYFSCVVATAAIAHIELVLDEVAPSFSSSLPNKGTVTYDETKLTGVGEETLAGSDASFSLLFDGLEYTQVDDPDSGFPQYYFTDGEFVGLEFQSTLKSASATPDSYLDVQNNEMIYSYDAAEAYKGHLEVVTVPEPSSIGFILLSSACLLKRRRA